MLSVTINSIDYRLSVVRYPDNSTDFVISQADDVLGLFSLRLMAQTDSPTFIVGQAIPSGMEPMFEGTSTRIIDNQTYAVNCVYQLNLVERTDAIELDNDTASTLLCHAVAGLSGYKGDADTLHVLSVGSIIAKQVSGEIHYMVGDVIFSKVVAPQ